MLYLKNVLKNENIMYKIKMKKKKWRNGENEKKPANLWDWRESYTLKDRANKVSFIYDEKIC